MEYFHDIMKQSAAILKLRALQLWRFLRNTGIGILLIAIFVLTGSILSILEYLMELNHMYTPIICASIFLAIDFYRNDKTFLYQVFGNPSGAFIHRGLEYFILVFPITIFQLYNGHVIAAFLACITPLVASFIGTMISKPIKSGHKYSFDFIPLKYYEMRFQMEKNKVFILLIIALLYLGWVHISLWILGIVLLLSIILESFSHKEPIEMIHWKEGYVQNKIVNYLLIIVPILLVSASVAFLSNDIVWWVYAYGIAAIMVALSLSISVKYAEYNALSETVHGKTPMTIFIFMMLLPGFILVSIGYTIIKYQSAERQMKRICSN